MVRFSVLGSGSGGNAAVVACGETRLLVDAGLSARQLTARLALVGIDAATLDGVLLTHEHGDHIRGLKVLLKQHPHLPVYTTAQTALVVRQTGIEGGRWRTFECGQSFTIRDSAVRSFHVEHDAVDPVGFVLGAPSGRALGLLSDAGHVTRAMTESLRGLHGLFIEANYDDHLLEADTKRPWSIKQRIASRHGHLSNEQAANLLAEVAHAGLRRVVLGHLSSDCNHPDTAIRRLRLTLAAAGCPDVGLHCACQSEPTPWFEI